MNKPSIKDYVHLYPGCRVETVDGPGINLGHYYPDVWLKVGNYEPNGINVHFQRTETHGAGVFVMNYNQCKLVLTPMDQISIPDALELVKLRSEIYQNVDILIDRQINNGFTFEFEYNSSRRRRHERIYYRELNQLQVNYLLRRYYDYFNIEDFNKIHTTNKLKYAH